MAGLNSDLRIPEKVYVKFQRRSRDKDEGGEYVLGFMTPYDPKDKQFKDRKMTVDRWSDRRRRGQQKSILDKQAWLGYNEPMSGFKILHTVSRYRTSNKVWRILDPRGFELEISSWNLSDLLQQATLENGVVKNECVWARSSNGDNWLIPVDCEAYKIAKEYTEVRNTRISLRDVNRGDIVTLHDGRHVLYLGGMYHLTTGRNWKTKAAELDIKREYVFLVRDDESDSWDDAKLRTKSSIKVGAMIKETDKPLTKAQAQKRANEEWAKRSRSHRQFFHADKFTEEDIEVFLEDYDVGGVEDPLDFPMMVADTDGGKTFMFGGSPYRNDEVYILNQIQKEPLLSDLLPHNVTRKEDSNRYYSNRYNIKAITREIPVDQLADLDWKSVHVRIKGEDTFPIRFKS